MSITRTGRIYRIIHNESDVVYVGATFNRLSDRWSQHKCAFKRWLADKSRGACSIYPHFEEHGLEPFSILLIKEYQVLDRKHLEAYETLWIKKLHCCNHNSPFQIPRLGRIAYCAKYYENNREQLLEYHANYYNRHRAEILAKQNARQTCDCGGRHTRNNKRVHERTNKHQQWLEARA